MFCCVCPGLEFSFHCGFREHPRITDKEINGIDTGVEIILDDVEIPVV